MAIQPQQHKFFEIIKPGTNYEFIGKERIFLGLSLVAVLICLAMLPLNAYVFKGRGHMLNWGVDFRGGTELLIEFSKQVDAAHVRDALGDAGYEGADVVRYGESTGSDSTGSKFMVRLGSVSVVSADHARRAEAAMKKEGDANLHKFEWSEGGDKLYLRYDRAVDPAVITQTLKTQGITSTQVQPFGRSEDHTYEVTLIGLDTEVRKALDAKLGAGSVSSIPQVSSVGAKAGKQLQMDGVKSIVGAILLVVIYVALRFDLRYGPGTVVALLHDAIVTIGAFAITYREFSLTTLAAVLTIIGFSMNDTIVVFDRIRENAVRFRDRRFDRVVNQSVNETLSRTILTSATVFLVTLAMNIFGTGVVRDFAFAMNVGVIVGTYSSIFVAAPILIWLNDKYVASQKAVAARPSRRTVRAEEEPVET